MNKEKNLILFENALNRCEQSSAGRTQCNLLFPNVFIPQQSKFILQIYLNN